MEVKIKCPWCGREYTVDSSIIGQTVKCISCDKQFKAESISSRSIPSYMIQKMKSACSSEDPIPIENSSSEAYGKKTIGNVLEDFFDFRIMVTPFFIRTSFVFLFLGGSYFVLRYPFVTIWKDLDTKNPWSIFLFCLGYVVYVVLGIPLFAVILHALYELTMIPFSILDVLKEIREKLDEKAKS